MKQKITTKPTSGYTEGEVFEVGLFGSACTTKCDVWEFRAALSDKSFYTNISSLTKKCATKIRILNSNGCIRGQVREYSEAGRLSRRR